MIAATHPNPPNAPPGHRAAVPPSVDSVGPMARALTRHHAALLAAFVAVSLLGPGCASSDDPAASKRSDERETTTTDDEGPDDDRALSIGQQVVSSDDLDTVDVDMQVCVGGAFVDEFGDDAERVAETADGSSDDLTDDERSVLIDSVDACIPSSAFAEFFLATVYDDAGLGAPDTAEVDCLARATEGQVGQIVDALDRSDDPPTALLDTLDVCIAPTTITALVEAGLRQAGDELPLTDAQITCLAEAAAPSVSFAELALGDSSSLQAAITAALPSCPG